MGFPIRTSRDHCFIASSPALFAGLHVLLRLSSPRHPPDALIHLTLSFEEPSDFVTIGVDYQSLLRFPTLIKLTALLCTELCLLSFTVQSIQSSPKYFWPDSFQTASTACGSRLHAFPIQPTLSLFVDFGFPIC